MSGDGRVWTEEDQRRFDERADRLRDKLAREILIVAAGVDCAHCGEPQYHNPHAKCEHCSRWICDTCYPKRYNCKERIRSNGKASGGK